LLPTEGFCTGALPPGHGSRQVSMTTTNYPIPCDLGYEKPIPWV